MPDVQALSDIRKLIDGARKWTVSGGTSSEQNALLALARTERLLDAMEKLVDVIDPLSRTR